MTRWWPALLVLLLATSGCNLNPFHKEKPNVVFMRWETRSEGWRTAVFKNKGDKAALNVRVRLERQDGTGGEGNTYPDDVAEGAECVASLKVREKDLGHEFKVVWIEWD